MFQFIFFICEHFACGCGWIIKLLVLVRFVEQFIHCFVSCDPGETVGDIFFLPTLLLSIFTPLFSPSSSVSMSVFILAVPMR